MPIAHHRPIRHPPYATRQSEVGAIGEDDRAVLGDGDGVLGVGAARAVGGTQGPAVLRILEDLVGGLEEPWFDGDDQAFAQLVAVVGAAVVRHVMWPTP